MTISRPRNVADALEPGAPAWTRARGTLIHAWMEHIEWLDGTPLTADRLRTTCDAEGVPWTGATESLAHSVVSVLKAGAVRDLLTRHATTARHAAGSTLEALRERPIAVRATAPGESRPGLLVGRIDRLVIARRDGHPVSAEIIDYKTQTAPEPEAEWIDAYGPQLRAYRSAVSAMLSLPPDRVRCCVALVLLNRVIWVD